MIRRLEASGLGARRFCEREGLSEHRLHWWRRTLRQRDQGEARHPRGTGADGPVREGAGSSVRGRGDHEGDSAFLPVGLPFSVGGPIEVVHPRGHVVRVPAVFDAAALGRVLAAIDGQTGARRGRDVIATSVHTKMYLAKDATDMRKGFPGLVALTEAVLRQEPTSGHLFVFLNRRRDLMKVLYWDGTGFCIWAKRLERGSFQRPPAVADDESSGVELSAAQLTMMLEGIDLTSVRQRVRYHRRPA